MNMKIFESTKTTKQDVWKTEIKIDVSDQRRLQKLQVLLQSLKEKVVEKQ